MNLDTSFLFAILFDKLCQSIMLIWQSIKIMNNNFIGKMDCKVYLENSFQGDTPGWESPRCRRWAPSQPAGSQLRPRQEEEAQTIWQGSFSRRRGVLSWVTLGVCVGTAAEQSWSSHIYYMLKKWAVGVTSVQYDLPTTLLCCEDNKLHVIPLAACSSSLYLGDSTCVDCIYQKSDCSSSSSLSEIVEFK